MKEQKIEHRLTRIEQRLRNAQAYAARNENVERASFLHLRDWEGKSGHPLWIKNFMIPATLRARALNEKRLERLITKQHDRKSQKRRKSKR